MNYFALVFPLVIVFAAVALALAQRAPFRSLEFDAANGSAAVSANRRVRLRNVTAIAAAVIVACTVTAVALEVGRTTVSEGPLDVMQLLLLTPILTAIVAVAFFAFVPTFRETSDARSAELDRRTPLSFGPRSVFMVPSAAAVLLAILVLAFGFLADPDGRSLTYFPNPWMGGGGGPFPGFVYGLPLLIGIAVLATVVVIALRRIASAPRPSDPSLREADSTLRLLGIRVVTKAATSALVLTVAFLLIMAGSVAASMNSGTHHDGMGNIIPADATMQVIGTLGTIALWLGVVFVGAAIVFIVGAVGDATRKPFEITHPAEVAA